MTETHMQMLISFYLVNLVINIVISLIQWSVHKNQFQRNVFLYWMSCVIAIAANAFFSDMPVVIVYIAGLASFLSNYIMSLFLVQSMGLEFNTKKILLVFLVSFLCSYLTYQMNFHFYVYSLIGLIGADVPVAFAVYKVIKEKKRRSLSLVQKMYFVACILMALHYLDWPWFRLRPELFFWGVVVAFILFQFLTILMPMMANESFLREKASHLQDEINEKVKELTVSKEKLWESQKMASIGRMAGGVAHEINTPLQIIDISADLLKEQAMKEKGALAEAVINGTNKIQSVIERISKITNTLRRVSREESMNNKKNEDFNDIIQNAIDLMADHIRKKQIDVKVKLLNSPAIILCNRAEILQIILNLISNAVDAIENLETKNIKITLTDQVKRFELAIEDSGIIKQEIADQIMEPFFTTKPVGKGVGLGLSLSKSIVENHDGELFLDKSSSYTRFVLSLLKADE